MTSATTAALGSAGSQTSSSTILARLARPSFTDILFVGILLWTVVLTAAGWQRLLWDADTGLHIRIGNFILENGYVPTTDPLSFTRNGTHWLATEWLTGVLFSTLNAHFGLKAVVFLCGVVIAATLTLLLRTCLRAGANSLLALVVVLMTMNASAFHFHARPHVFTWLFLAITLHILTIDAIAPAHWLWMLAPLTAVWANLHGGYAVMFVVLGAVTVGTRKWKRYGGLTVLCGLASLVNPFGYKLHVETFNYLRNRSVMSTIQEFQPPDFRSEPQLYFLVLLFASLAICGLLLAKRRYAETLLIAGFGYLGLTSVRHIPLFLIVAAPILTAELTVHWNRWAGAKPASSIAGILRDLSDTVRGGMQTTSLWSAAALIALWTLPAAASWPQDFGSDRFPVEIAQRHSAELAASRLFTTDQWADYLMFHNPAQRVFVDDRVGYSDQIIADALRLMSAEAGWQDVLAKYRIDAVLCPNSAPLATRLDREPGWHVIDQDTTCRYFRKESAGGN